MTEDNPTKEVFYQRMKNHIQAVFLFTVKTILFITEHIRADENIYIFTGNRIFFQRKYISQQIPEEKDAAKK